MQPPTSLPYTIQTWTFGDDLGMVFLPGEVVVDYSLRLKKELGADLWVTAYANDVPCYIASGRVISEGGYEVDGSMPTFDKPTRLAVETEELIVGAVHELLPERAKRASETSNEFGCRASQRPLDHLRGHESQLGLLRRRLCGDPKPGPAGRPGLQLAPSPDEGVGGLRCEPNIQCGFSDDAFVRAIRARPIRQLEVSLSPIPTETVIARHVVPEGP